MGGTRDSQGFADGLIGNPLFNLGVGLLAAGGPSETPLGVGQGLSQGLQLARQGQQAALRNQLVRTRLEEEARKRAAGARLSGLLDDQDPLLGALAEVSPGATAQSVLAQRNPRTNSVIEQAKFIHPNDPVAQREFVARNAGGSGEALDRALKLIQLQGAEREEVEAREATQRVRAGRESAVEGAFDNLLKLGKLTTDISITEPRASISKGVQFNRIVQDQAIDEALNRLGESGGLSATELRAVVGTKPSLFTTLGGVPIPVPPEANAATISSKLKALLRGSDRLGRKIPQAKRKQIEDEINRLDQFALSGDAVSRQPQQTRRFTPQTLPRDKRQLRRGDVLQDGPITREWTGNGFRIVN